MSDICQTIIDRHTDGQEIDEEQIMAIFSSESHLLVEAPAGYGKTKTMISKIAYLIATGQLTFPKKILALTFSINAAFKIRRDIRHHLPLVLPTSNDFMQSALQIVYATNYHGLCRRILNRYGYLVAPNLFHVDKLKGVGIDIYDDEDYTKRKLVNHLQDWGIELDHDEIDKLIQFTSFIKKAGDRYTRLNACRYLAQNSEEYLQIVKKNFLPKEYILFDAILLFTRHLLNDYPQMRDFYRRFFQVVIVDEFQDTNILQWTLLQDLAGRDDEWKNPLFVFGDRYQKIYEFIGAMQGIMDDAKSQYRMQEIRLRTNHRFKANLALLRFDENVRRVLQNPNCTSNETAADIEVIRSANQDEEAEKIIDKIKKFLEEDANCTLAILTRAGKTNQNTIKIIEQLNKEQAFTYFFALYSDEDQEYIDFHRKCLTSLYANLPKIRSFWKLSKVMLEEMELESPSETWESLRKLLSTFLLHISQEFRFLAFEEKVDLVIDTLRNKALKQYLMYVNDSQIVLSTVHGSKGLEWDYVILPDMERYSFPHYLSLCKFCGFRQNCQLDWRRIHTDSEFTRFFKQELNLFYVGGTRARKKVCFTFSDKGLNAAGKTRDNKMSCFLNLSGLHHV
jgi:DNA helicase-2/ATP-dependent DNA helicase PcrA